MKSFIKKIQDNQISAILAIAAVVVMTITLALTLNGTTLQDNVFKSFGHPAAKPKTTNQQTQKDRNKPKPPLSPEAKPKPAAPQPKTKDPKTSKPPLSPEAKPKPGSPKGK